MAISSTTGIGSGIDYNGPNGIINQLITAEGQPQYNAIARQETETKTRLSGLGSLKSALSSFQTAVQKLKDPNLYKATQAVSAKPDIFTVTTGLGAVPGTHSVEVTSLAKAQQLTTEPGYSGLGAEVSAAGGTLNFTYPTAGSTKTPFSVTIAAHATLANVRDAINSATGNNGVTASIINVDSTPGTTVSKLVLTSKDTGTANAFSVDAMVNGGALGDGLELLKTSVVSNYDKVDAVDAKIKVDGQTATRSSNTITDVLQGVTLNLQSGALLNTPVNLDVTLDTTSISKTIGDFVTAYNSLNSTSHSLGQYGGTAAGATNGALLGDWTLRSITSQLRQDTSNTVSSVTSNYNSLAMIGISIDKTGVMSLDSTKLTTALTANLSAVSDVFTSSNGVATRLDSRLKQYLQSGGVLDAQQTALNKKLSTFTTKRADVKSRLDNLQAAMLKQFTAMDAAVGQMKSTATYLSKQFA